MDVPATPDKQRKPSPAIENAVNKLWTHIRRAGELIVTLRDDNVSLQARVEELESGLSHRESAHQRLDLEQRETSELLDSIEAERVQLAAELAELKTEHQALKHQVESDKQSLEQTSGQLEEFRSASKDNEFLRAELVSRNNQIHAGQKEILEYRNRIAELENTVAQLQKQADQAPASQAEGESDADDPLAGRSEIDALRAELDRMRRLYDEVSIERERLRQSREPYQADLFSTGAIENEWREKNRELYAEIERLADEKSRAEDGLRDAHAEADELRSQISELKQRIAELEDNLGRRDVERREREAQALQLRRQVDQLSTRLKALENTTSHDADEDPGDSGESLAQSRERIEELEQELAQARLSAADGDVFPAAKRDLIERKVRDALARIDSLLKDD